MIILPFPAYDQLVADAPTFSDGKAIVMYDPDSITGYRIAAAPIEDLLFGFALVLSVMGLVGVLGSQRIPAREKITVKFATVRGGSSVG